MFMGIGRTTNDDHHLHYSCSERIIAVPRLWRRGRLTDDAKAQLLTLHRRVQLTADGKPPRPMQRLVTNQRCGDRPRRFNTTSSKRWLLRVLRRLQVVIQLNLEL